MDLNSEPSYLDPLISAWVRNWNERRAAGEEPEIINQTALAEAVSAEFRESGKNRALPSVASVRRWIWLLKKEGDPRLEEADGFLEMEGKRGGRKGKPLRRPPFYLEDNLLVQGFNGLFQEALDAGTTANLVNVAGLISKLTNRLNEQRPPGKNELSEGTVTGAVYSLAAQADSPLHPQFLSRQATRHRPHRYSATRQPRYRPWLAPRFSELWRRERQGGKEVDYINITALLEEMRAEWNDRRRAPGERKIREVEFYANFQRVAEIEPQQLPDEYLERRRQHQHGQPRSRKAGPAVLMVFFSAFKTSALSFPEVSNLARALSELQNEKAVGGVWVVDDWAFRERPEGERKKIFTNNLRAHRLNPLPLDTAKQALALAASPRLLWIGGSAVGPIQRQLMARLLGDLTPSQGWLELPELAAAGYTPQQALLHRLKFWREAQQAWSEALAAGEKIAPDSADPAQPPENLERALRQQMTALFATANGGDQQLEALHLFLSAALAQAENKHPNNWQVRHRQMEVAWRLARAGVQKSFSGPTDNPQLPAYLTLADQYLLAYRQFRGEPDRFPNSPGYRPLIEFNLALRQGKPTR